MIVVLLLYDGCMVVVKWLYDSLRFEGMDQVIEFHTDGC